LFFYELSAHHFLLDAVRRTVAPFIRAEDSRFAIDLRDVVGGGSAVKGSSASEWSAL
jgi:hypothetical protein